MEYDIYHDESQKGGYWHGMLLVPRSTRRMFLAGLEHIRQNTGFDKPISLKKLKNAEGAQYRCIRGWINLAAGALIQKEGKPFPVYTGRDGQTTGFKQLQKIIGARFILFRVRGGHQGLAYGSDYGSKVETTFRIGLKGGLHLFARHGDNLTVASFHFDGHEHYGRRVDAQRILGRLGRLKKQVRIASDFQIFDDSSDHTKANAQAHDDCQFLQLTDLLVSGFRAVLGEGGNPAQTSAIYPLRQLSERWRGGYARMKKSRCKSSW